MKKVLGFLGIILGALLGMGLYVLVGQFNIFSSWAGALGFSASIFLYKFFAGQHAKGLAIFIAMIVNCVSLFVAEVIDMALKIAKELSVPFDFVLSKIHNIIEDLAEAGQLTDFVIYPIIGSIFVIVAAFFTFKENRNTFHAG